MLQLSGTMPRPLTRPYVGRSPETPQNDAGMRTDPPVSVPRVSVARPAGSAPPGPALDPPVVRDRSHGLRASPNRCISPEANSVVFSLPRQMAPACRSLAATTQSAVVTLPTRSREPAVVGRL